MKIVLLFLDGTWIEKEEKNWYYSSPQHYRSIKPEELRPLDEKVSEYAEIYHFKKIFADYTNGIGVYKEMEVEER